MQGVFEPRSEPAFGAKGATKGGAAEPAATSPKAPAAGKDAAPAGKDAAPAGKAQGDPPLTLTPDKTLPAK